LLLLALLALAFADSSSSSSSSSLNYGVDDDDSTDKTDRAGRVAFNKANNVEQFVTKYWDVIKKLCPYWPRKDNEDCEFEAKTCLLEQLTKQGELKDHITLEEKCKPKGSKKSYRNAIQVAENYGQKMANYALLKEREVKTLCHNDDDPCKNNVECKILSGLNKVYGDIVSLKGCAPLPVDSSVSVSSSD